MPLGYNPNDKQDTSRAEPGDYDFTVESVTERTFNSGNSGLEVKLHVAAFANRDVTAFDRFVYTGKALWKLEQFFQSIGLDFSNPPEGNDLLQRRGRATFVHDDRKYLVPETYHPASANNGPDSWATPSGTRSSPPGGNEGAPPMDDEDVPF